MEELIFMKTELVLFFLFLIVGFVSSLFTVFFYIMWVKHLKKIFKSKWKYLLSTRSIFHSPRLAIIRIHFHFLFTNKYNLDKTLVKYSKRGRISFLISLVSFTIAVIILFMMKESMV